MRADVNADVSRSNKLRYDLVSHYFGAVWRRGALIDFV